MRDADHRQADTDRHADGHIDNEQSRQILPDLLSCFVRGLSRSMKVVPTAEPKQPVPQSLPVNQDHNDKDDHEPARRQWLEQRSYNALDELKRFKIGLAYFNWHRLRRFGNRVTGRRQTLHRTRDVGLRASSVPSAGRAAFP